MNNWHIKIEDCTEAQKERLKQFYGGLATNFSFLALVENRIDPRNVIFDPSSELITPDEAFERLGLGEDTKALAKCENSIVKTKKQLTRRTAKLREAEQIIKELTQQLAAKPELQGVDWSIIEPEYNWLAQNKGSGTIDFHRVKPTDSNYAILETRPKSKYTPEQIEAVKDFDAWVSRRHKLSGEFNWWLKEVGNGY